MTVQPGTQTVQFSASGQKTEMPVALAVGSVHTIVVLDGSAGLKVGVPDRRGRKRESADRRRRHGPGAAPLRRLRPAKAQWLAALAAGLLLIAVGTVGLRRSRRTAVLRH